MKSPDKIYLHKIRDEESSGFHKMWFEQRARCVPSEEYIRKDLLMEWLEAKVYEHNEDKFDDGFNTAIGQIIDKGTIYLLANPT